MKSAFLIAMFLSIVWPASAQQPPPPLPQRVLMAQTNDVVETVFSEIEKRIIREALGKPTGAEQSRSRGGKGKKKNKSKKKGKKGLPPGLAKRDKLPPGLARQLERNGTLPPGLQKRELPADLEQRLPSRKNTKRVIVGNDVLLVQKGTNMVLDILEGVIRDATK